MSVPDEILDVYRRYWEGYDEAVKRGKIFGGAFGLRGGLGQDPCHDRFARELEAALAGLAPAASSEQARETLAYIYQMPLEYRDKPCLYWMLMAVHGLTLPLVARLNAGDAAGLRAEFEKSYPRRDRLDPQKKVLAALKERAGQPR